MLRRRFLETYGEGPGEIHVFFAPGRVNLIGEHIDYNGGYVLPVALSIGIYAAVRYSEPPGRGSSTVSLDEQERTVHLASVNEPGRASVDLSESILYEPSRGWANYPLGIIQQLQHGWANQGRLGWPCRHGRHALGDRCSGIAKSHALGNPGQSHAAGYNLRGCQVLYWGNLPVGAGLSSSAAIEVLTAYFMLYPALKDNLQSTGRIWLAQLCQRAENDFVKVQCGIMDQFAVAMGKRNHAILLDCASLDYRYIPVLLGDYSVVIMNTGKRRGLGESKYNRRRAECEGALSAIRSHSWCTHVENLAQATIKQVEYAFGLKRKDVLAKPRTCAMPSGAEQFAGPGNTTISDQVLRNTTPSGSPALAQSVLGRRARHVVTENLRTLEAQELLLKGDVTGFGCLMTESHMSLRDDYEVTGFELDAIVDAALSSDCCAGARMTGAGFGGCAIALVKSDCFEEFRIRVGKQYSEKTGLKAEFYACAIEDGVRRLE
ncbi:MAG TPA: galactokinase [Firmicutes bacterium]|nr:galactokinase [Candidatus Fermentithermobacillaceae bacterium]